MILHALVGRLKGWSKSDFKGRHFEASLIVQAVSWYLRYPLSYRDIEEMLRERGLEVDHSTLTLSFPSLTPRQFWQSTNGARRPVRRIGPTGGPLHRPAARARPRPS